MCVCVTWFDFDEFVSFSWKLKKCPIDWCSSTESPLDTKEDNNGKKDKTLLVNKNKQK